MNESKITAFGSATHSQAVQGKSVYTLCVSFWVMQEIDNQVFTVANGCMRINYLILM